MINFKRANIEKLVLHRYGQDEQHNISEVELGEDELMSLGGNAESVLIDTFLKPFAYLGNTYQFSHPVNTDLNVLNNLLNTYIAGESSFLNISQDAFKHLRNVSKHPNIKSGDVFVIEFDAVGFENEMYEAWAVVKVENKQSFIEVDADKNDMSIKKGITTGRLDKGALILNTAGGFTVFHIDSNKSETEYWKTDFLGITNREDNITATNDVISIARSFINTELPAAEEVSKADQIDLLNKSAEYFKTAEVYNVDEFEREVLVDEKKIQAFQKFQEKPENFVQDGFELSDAAVKKQAKFFKSVLKLDKNFSIYIHGNRNMVEKGIDEDTGKKYYKFYYEEER